MSGLDPRLSLVLYPGFPVSVWLSGSAACFEGLVHEIFVVLRGLLPVFCFLACQKTSLATLLAGIASVLSISHMWCRDRRMFR